MDLRELLVCLVVLCSSLAEAIRCKCTKESETVTCVDGVCEMEPGCEFASIFCSLHFLPSSTYITAGVTACIYAFVSETAAVSDGDLSLVAAVLSERLFADGSISCIGTLRNTVGRGALAEGDSITLRWPLSG
ncbi:unnamed protein product [Heligmosomoides polygyrus]|uniref:Secreted protein n=1 Tax=Heligmosomoides polygyrus TaxID=6339 RepID=A0A183G9T8_HELPZ|nr:unnamed protein product [Heligmosomoides polygyrus]